VSSKRFEYRYQLQNEDGTTIGAPQWMTPTEASEANQWHKSEATGQAWRLVTIHNEQPERRQRWRK